MKLKDYSKFLVALATTILMALHAGISDGSLVLPIPKIWEGVILAFIGALLVLLVRNGDKPEVERIPRSEIH